MRRSKRAGWYSPAGSYSYMHEDLWRPEKKSRRPFRYVKFAAALMFLLAAAAAVILQVLPGRHTSHQVASATTLPRVAIQAKIMESKRNVSAQLSSELSSFVSANKSQQWGVSLHQLNGGDSQAVYQADKTFYPASVNNFLLLESLFEKLPYSKWVRGIGGSSFSDCVSQIVQSSDDSCGPAIGSYVGWTAANKRLKAIGLTNTLLTPSDGQQQTTAADVDTYLQYFYHSYDYPDAKLAVMNDMSGQNNRSGIPAGSPGCTVYDKIGDLNGFRHDAAVVDCGSIKYTLVIMTQGGSYAQIADLASRLNRVIAPGS